MVTTSDGKLIIRNWYSGEEICGTAPSIHNSTFLRLSLLYEFFPLPFRPAAAAAVAAAAVADAEDDEVEAPADEVVVPLLFEIWPALPVEGVSSSIGR